MEATTENHPENDRGDDAEATIAVTVIGGYLGAGKTTLVNHILRTADERVAVLVNDFGAINIDAELIESADGDTISLANGCICCSLVDGFAAALSTVRELVPLPRRLVIEASGVADPASVAAYGHGRGLSLDAVVVVVDAETIRHRSQDRYVGDTVLAQLRSADIVVVNKVDLIGDGSVASLMAWLGRRSPGSVVVQARQAEVAPELLFGQIDPANERPRGPTHDHVDSGEHPQHGEHGEHRQHRAADIFESWSWTGDRPVDREVIEELMASLPEAVVRAKGVLSVTEEPDRRMILQRVGHRWSLRPGAPWSEAPTSRLVVIGTLAAIEDGWLDARLGR